MIIQILQSTNRYNNWYFGVFAGITFNTENGEPIELNDGLLYTQEGCATISDEDGNLQLYTDGFYAYNKNHQLIPDADFLGGNFSAAQSSIIVPKPNSASIYYIFSVTQLGEDGGANYSIIDIDGNNGIGAVIEKRVNLLQNSTEHLTATKHANGVDYWVMLHDANSADFYSYLVTADGVSKQPVVTNIGYDFSLSDLPETRIGQMKFTISGEKLAMTNYQNNHIWVFDFDNATGQITSGFELNDEIFYDSYGLEFSPNEKYLYISNHNIRSQNTVYKLDVSLNSPLDILNSASTIYRGDIPLGSLQLAPNGKIYLAKLLSDNLGAINRPNEDYQYEYFDISAFTLQNGRVLQGLPQAIVADFNPSISIVSNSPYCEGDEIWLRANYNYIQPEDVFIEWTLPNKTKFENDEIKISNANTNDSGEYIVEITYYGNTYYDTLNIFVSEKPYVEVTSDTVICDFENFILSVNDSSDYTYLWSTGSTDHFTTVSEPGIYTVEVTNQYGCITQRDIRVELGVNFNAEIEGDQFFCYGETVQLDAKPLGNYSYLWSTGEFTSSITVDEPGGYSVIIENNVGCKDTAYFNLKSNRNNSFFISGPKQICEGEEAVFEIDDFSSEGIDSSNIEIRWSNGDKGLRATYDAEGKVWVEILMPDSCNMKLLFDLEIHPKPEIELNIEEKIVVCDGSTIQLGPKGNNSKLIYFWEDGDYPIYYREVEKSGVYKLIAENEFGCRDTAICEVVIEEFKNQELVSATNFKSCSGNPVEVWVDNPLNIQGYEWSNGESGEFALYSETGEHFVIIESKSGCLDTLYFEIEIDEKPAVEIIASQEGLCWDENIILSIDGDYKLVEWSNGSNQNEIAVGTQGVYWVKVANENNCVAVDSIEVFEYDFSKIINDDSIKITDICIGENQEYGIELENTIALPISISEVNSNSDLIEIMSFPSDLEVGKTDQITFKVNTNLPGTFSEIIHVWVSEPCSQRIDIPISVDIYTKNVVQAGSLRSDPGEKECIPVSIFKECISDSVFNSDFTCKVILNRNAINFENIQGAELIDKNEDFSKIELFIEDNYTFDYSTGTQDLFEICVQTLLTNERESDLIIEVVIFEKENIFTRIENGKIIINEVCLNDSRLIRLIPAANIEIENSVSNPIVNLHTYDTGVNNFRIVDITGNTIYSETWQNSQKGHSVKTLNVYSMNLSQGFYILQLLSEGKIANKKLVITK